VVDSDTPPQRVDFYVDGRLIGSDDAAPFEIEAPALADGMHVIRARAIDWDVSSWSAPATIFVGPAPRELLIDSEGLRAALFAAVNAEEMRRAESTPEGLVDSALITAIVIVKRLLAEKVRPIFPRSSTGNSLTTCVSNCSSRPRWWVFDQQTSL
jgi:hypothetical protein